MCAVVLCLVIVLLLSVLFSFAIISLKKGKLVVLLKFSFCCHLPVSVLCRFLTVPCYFLFQYQMVFLYLNEVLSDICSK